MNSSRAARTLKRLCYIVALAPTLLTRANATAQGIPFVGPEDSAIAIDLDAVPVGAINNGRYPAAENPPKAIDGLVAIPPSGFSKYLNFGAEGSGFIVSPTLSGVPVDGFQITTANDAPARDPASYALYGFNGTLTTTDSGPDDGNAANGVEINPTGLAEAWTLIDSGSLSLPGDPLIGNDQRGVLGPMVSVNSFTGYDHYKMIFPTIKNPAISNIMQIAEIQFFADDTDPNSGFLIPGDPTIAVDETPVPPGWSGSSFPGSEGPAQAIDQFLNGTGQASTKYLNFGEEQSGIIITNSGGPVQVLSMGLTTANDAVERDPASYQLYGTNDPITSEQNSNSNGTEVWTLISSGPLSLPGTLPNGGGDDFRFTETIIPINADNAYSSYRLIFPTVKDAASANSMQIADIQLYAVPEPSSTALVAMIGLGWAAARQRRS